MTECNWCKDEICVNADCPICCDYCPVPDTEGVCKFEDRSERHFTVEGLTMAKEYVEREVISEGIRKYYYKNPPNSSYQEGFDRGLDKAQRVILNAPVADVVEVRHGRWVNTHSDSEFAQCSLCKYPVYAAWIWNLTNYCPNCGAKMDKEEYND